MGGKGLLQLDRQIIYINNYFFPGAVFFPPIGWCRNTLLLWKDGLFGITREKAVWNLFGKIKFQLTNMPEYKAIRMRKTLIVGKQSGTNGHLLEIKN